MDWLITLLAFAGVMAFLSTLLSVFMEGVHKALGLRRAGLEEMLRALHQRVLVRLDPTSAQLDASEMFGEGDRRAGDRFARRMTENISFRGRGWFAFLRAIPIVREFVERRHEQLSTLQFVEQMARTDVGETLGAMDRAQRRRALVAAAYEFERFGDSQSAYFRSRARIMSVVFALAFAFAANIDALEIYKRLRTDMAVRDFFASTDVAALERTLREAETAESADARQVRETLAAGLVSLRSQGVPLGYAAFPWCRAPERVAPVNEAALVRDRRCGDGASSALSLHDAWIRASRSSAGWIWFLSVLLAGGLIGLGAPFWYQVFRRLARAVPAAQSVRAVLQPESAPTPSPASQREAVRDPNAATPEALLIAFDVASGEHARSVAGYEAAGGRMIVRGDGSLVVPAAMRHLR